VICSVKIDVRNDGEDEYKSQELQSVEMVLVNKDGEVEYSPWTKPIDFSEKPSATNQQGPIYPGQSVSNTLYFVHSKGYVPAAFVSNRVEQLILLKGDDPRNEKLKAALAKASAIQTALQMASIMPFDVVSDFMTANGLDINYSNRNGISLLYAGIFSANDSVVEGAIRQGADIHSVIMMSIYPIEPIHAAVLANNKFAIRALLAAGASLTAKPKDGDEPAVLAARENNVDALKTLVEFGIDIKSVMIPMNWSPAIPITKFAQRPGYQAMLEYLNSL
jgi:hypothetical protein